MRFDSQNSLNLFSNLQHRFSLISIVTIFLPLCWLLTLTQPALAEPSPQSCKVGVYLLSLRDFSPSNKSFGGDFWIWSNCRSKDLKPLESMEVVNGKDVQTAYDSVEEKKNPLAINKSQKSQEKIVWAQRKISATFQHNWMVANFPFDRHQLEIPLEETKLVVQDFVYTPDVENSSYKQDMNLEGWKIKKFEIRERPEKYRSTFGDPDLKNGDESEYSRLSILINIERDSTLSFFKLITGVYAAFATILLAFFLDTGAEFGNRTGLLVGSLFAVLVSMQSIDSVLGQSDVLTMVDMIHVTTLGYVFVAVLAAVYSKRLHEQGYEKESLKFDRKICSSLFGISFTVFNAIMITHAMLKG
jgi:hypothetical protein